MPLDETDKKLLDVIQGDLPLSSEPYHEIGSVLGTPGEDVILRLQRLKDDGIIRRIGAIFDSKKLGYCSTLCAMKAPDQRIDEVAGIINEYTGVTHNYLRNHEYNVWFTITARSRWKLDEIMAEIQEKSRLYDLIDLPAVRLFKIRVRFSIKDTKYPPSDPDVQYSASSIQHPVSSIQKCIVRKLQGDIPLSRRPFKPIADKLGIEEEDLLIKLRELKDRGFMRRFSGILRHRNLGIRANAMGVWRVPESIMEEVGTKMAAFSQVSHCYQRLTRPGWPYNLFTMIHGRTVEDCEQTAKLISQDTGIEDYRLLYSTRELKKVSMKYFTEKDGNNERTL